MSIPSEGILIGAVMGDDLGYVLGSDDGPLLGNALG